MITLQTADNALKSFYLDAVTEAMNCKISPFLASVEKTSAYVTGKEIVKVVKTGFNSGIGAGTETGDLPDAGESEYVALKLPLKNLYGTIEISDKAIRASANNEGAFVNLLNDEMESLLKSAKHNFSRMLFGNGTGRIGSCMGAKGAVLTMDTIKGLEPGMYIDIYNGNTKVHSGKKILSIEREERKITLDSGSWSGVDLVGYHIVMSGTPLNCEITGLNKIFEYDEIYGVERTHEFLCPYSEDTIGDISEELVQRVIDMLEEKSGGKINMLLCSRGVRRAIQKYLRENQLPVSTVEMADGSTSILFCGVPVVVDDFCANGTMYLLNTDDFKLCQLCDWQWMEGEDGKILKQVAGKPVYTATLVKYADLICERPCGQGKLMDISEE